MSLQAAPVELQEAGMICKECRKAKPFAIGSMYCLLYGIIIDEKHEGNLEGCDREYEYPRGGNG